MKEFNTTGVCIPEKHYMVDISNKLAQIEKMVKRETILLSTDLASMGRPLLYTCWKKS